MKKNYRGYGRFWFCFIPFDTPSTLTLNMETTTHDLMPYIGIRFSLFSFGSWVDVLFSVEPKPVFTKNTSLFDKSYLRESLHFVEKKSLAVKRLMIGRDHAFVFEREHKTIREMFTQLHILYLQSKYLKYESKLINLQKCVGNSSYDQDIINNNFSRSFHAFPPFEGLGLYSILTSLEQKKIMSWNLSQQTTPSVVSVAGCPLSLNIKLPSHKDNILLDIVWMHGFYSKFRSFLNTEPERCTGESTSFGYCLRFPTFLRLEQSILFMRGKSFLKIVCATTLSWQRQVLGYKEHQTNVCWNEASRLCAAFAALLPVFMSREEVEKFLALIKFSPYLPPVEAAFVRIVPKMVRCWVISGCNLNQYSKILHTENCWQQLIFLAANFLFVGSKYTATRVEHHMENDSSLWGSTHREPSAVPCNK